MFAIQSNERRIVEDQIHIFISGRFDTPFETEIDLLRQSDVSVHTIGIENVDTRELTRLHSLAKQPSYYWTARDMNSFSSAAEPFYNTVCLGAPGPNIVIPTPEPPAPQPDCRKYLF